MKPDAGLRIGLYGLRAVAAEIDADCEEGYHSSSEHYCYMTSKQFGDLPSHVIGYLEAVAR